MVVVASAQSAGSSTPELFGAVHLSLLAVTALLGVVVIWGLRRIRGTAAEVVTTRTAGWVLLGVTLMWMGWVMLPANWDVGRSLPLHFSDALRFITALALIWRPRWAIAVCYFWGLTLNPQALLTPHPDQLMGLSVGTAFYWVLHIAVFLAPLALIWGVGYRPRWRDFTVTYALTLVWAALAMTVNAVLGTNYAFLNHRPEGPSVLDVLGPWPIYILAQMVLVALVWALMTWPWTRPWTQRSGLRNQGQGDDDVGLRWRLR